MHVVLVLMEYFSILNRLIHEVAKEATPANSSLLLNAPIPQMATARIKSQSPPAKAAPISLAPMPTTTLNSSASAVQDVSALFTMAYIKNA